MKRKKGLIVCKIVILFFCSLSMSINSQTKKYLVLPPNYEFIEGKSSTNFPFGRSTPFRLQDIYWKECFKGKARQIIIDGLYIRPDGGIKTQGKKFLRLNLYISSTPCPTGAAHQEFKLNRGKDFSLVFSGMINLPDIPGKIPNPFIVYFPFEGPFIYSTDQEGLLIEFEIFRQPPGRYPLDSPFICTSNNSRFGFSKYCISSSGKPIEISVNTSIKLGGNLLINLINGPKEKGAVAFLGTRIKGKFLGLTLPIDLTVYGAYGCQLLVPPLIVSKGKITSKTGTCAFNFVLPSNLYYLVGSYLYCQAFVYDEIANPIGLVFSNGVKAHICGPEPVGRVFSSGTVTANKGWFQFGSAHIIKINLF